jgi:hypothetical protein
VFVGKGDKFFTVLSRERVYDHVNVSIQAAVSQSVYLLECVPMRMQDPLISHKRSP